MSSLAVRTMSLQNKMALLTDSEMAHDEFIKTADICIPIKGGEAVQAYQTSWTDIGFNHTRRMQIDVYLLKLTL